MRIRALLVALATALAACDGQDASGPSVGPPASVAVVAGNDQNGTVAGELREQVVVRVADEDGDAVAGVPVTFVSTGGGGAFFAAVVETDAAGEARNRWTLGTVAGPQTAEARIVANGFLAAPLRATAAPGAPASLERVSPAHRAVPLGGSDSLAVRVRDALGNDVPGVTVAWTAEPGGSVSPGTSTTDAAGVAKTQWTPAVRVDATQTARASAAGAELAFTASALSPPAGTLVVTRQGDGQTGQVGTALADSLALVVSLPDGRPVHGVAVAWSTPGAAVGGVFPAAGTTDANGRVAARWILDSRAGPVTARFSVAGGPTGTFAAAATAGPATRLLRSGGVDQTGRPGRVLAQPLTARAVDGYGNLVRDAEIAWTVVSGGGTVSPAVSRVPAGGLDAATEWTLGDQVGTQEVRASHGTLAPVTYTATSRRVVLIVIQAPLATDTVGNTLSVRATVDADEPLAAVTLDVTGLFHDRPMTQAPDGTWRATVDVSSMPRGIMQIWVAARDVVGTSASRTVGFYHDPGR